MLMAHKVSNSYNSHLFCGFSEARDVEGHPGEADEAGLQSQLQRRQPGVQHLPLHS